MSDSRWDLNDLIAKCDGLIRNSQIQAARDLLMRLKIGSISRHKAQPIAHLHFRTGLFLRALEIIAPVVYPKVALKALANPAEVCTHAACLVKIGSVDEALHLMAPWRGKFAQADLYSAFAYQAQWDYQSAVPLLRAYLAYPELSDYDRAVAQVNLAACLIFTRDFTEAQDTLMALQKQVREQGWMLLEKNIQELLVQLAVWRGDYLKPETELAKLRPEDSLWDFLIDKWKAIFDIRHNPTLQSIETMRKIRVRALELSHWESVRECDRYIAVASKDTDLLLKVYFGTPFSAYRQALEAETRDWFQIPQSFVYGNKIGEIFNLATGIGSAGHCNLKAGQALHLGLLTLSSDLYRPLFVGHMFAKIFPQEYFNPMTAPGRVANVVKRLRKWFSAYNLPLKIEIKDQFHQLILDERHFGLQYSKQTASGGDTLGLEATLERLRQASEALDFTSVDAAEKLKVSKATVLKVLNWGVSSGHLKRAGNNRNTKYRFCA